MTTNQSAKNWKKPIIWPSGKSYVVTMPKPWAERIVQVSPEINIVERGDSISIHPKHKVQAKETIAADGNKNHLKHSLISAYIKGAEEIEVHYDNHQIKDRNGKTTVHEVVQEVKDKYFFGFNTVSTNPFTIKEATIVNDGEFDNTFKVAFNLLEDINIESLHAVSTNNNEKLTLITKNHGEVLKNIYYMKRILNKHGYQEFRLTQNMYSIVSNLQHISDAYRHIAKHFANIKRKNDALVQLYEHTNKMVALVNEIYHFKEPETIKKFFELRDLAYLEYEQLLANKNLLGILENLGWIRVWATEIVKEVGGKWLTKI